MEFEKKYQNTFHLTLSEKRFVEESLKILSIRNPEIETELENFITTIIKEPKDKISRGQQIINFLFKNRFPVISKKLQLLNKLKVKLKSYGINLSYDKMLEQNPKIVLPDGREIKSLNLELNNYKIDNSIKELLISVYKIFYCGM
jgi:hypothetical protein